MSGNFDGDRDARDSWENKKQKNVDNDREHNLTLNKTHTFTYTYYMSVAGAMARI